MTVTKQPKPAEPRSPPIPVGPRLEAVLELAYRARRPVLLEGPTGIGKSEVVRKVADRLGVATVVLDLSLLEPPDLVGLPVIHEGRTTYALPQVLPQGGRGHPDAGGAEPRRALHPAAGAAAPHGAQAPRVRAAAGLGVLRRRQPGDAPTTR